MSSAILSRPPRYRDPWLRGAVAIVAAILASCASVIAAMHGRRGS